ncbi:low-density lipoprotein receptor-related protein 4-like isoform X2 [Ptychodera flava]|uniref:low-density lipoprotein receptor-related protein 4-like isoform X2 n=1 Tax=Ptychodera flava TaxID=63121 RepID=UPI00396A37B2
MESLSLYVRHELWLHATAKRGQNTGHEEVSYVPQEQSKVTDLGPEKGLMFPLKIDRTYLLNCNGHQNRFFRCNKGTKRRIPSHDFSTFLALTVALILCGFTLEVTSVRCPNDNFRCSNQQCIPQRWICDGDRDCSDGSDEQPEICPGRSCAPDHFSCKDDGFECIVERWRCDGDEDCSNGRDEADCDGPKTCGPEKFACIDGASCIPRTWACDGQADCQDSSDEDGCEDAPRCTTNNGGCSQICQDTPEGPTCSCNAGFQLLEDQKTCLEIETTTVQAPTAQTGGCDVPGQCSQLCQDTSDGHRCSCVDGYELGRDNRSCTEAAETVLLFANRYDIRRINPETGMQEVIASGLRSAVSLDYDYNRGYLYWSDVSEEKIFRKAINGVGEVEVLIEQRVNTPDGVAVDWIYQNLYWTDAGTNKIEVAHLVPRHGAIQRAVLISEGLDEPRAIVVNPAEGFMYWTDWGDDARIEKAGMNGCGRTIVIHENIEWPNGLSIDYVNRRIFWVDGKLHLLASAGLNGEARVDVLSDNTGLAHPFSVSVFLNHVYWTEWGTEAIYRAEKFDGGHKTVIAQNLYSPMGIVAYHSLKQMPSRNNCGVNNGKCSHICVASPAISDCGANYTCMCPEGVELLEDGHTCNVSGILPHPDLINSTGINVCFAYPDVCGGAFCRKRNFNGRPTYDCHCPPAYDIDEYDGKCRAQGREPSLVFSDGGHIGRISLRSGAKETLIGNISKGLGVDVDVRQGLIYWADVRESKISRSSIGNLDNTTVLFWQHLHMPNGVAVDWVTGNVYWTDPNAIHIGNPGLGRRKKLFRYDIDEARSIALDPLNGWLYWTDWGKEPKIEKSGMDGSQRHVLIDSHIGWPNGLAIDFTSRRLYWIDAKLHVLATSDMHGKDRIDLIKGDHRQLRHPFSIAVFEDRVYWSDIIHSIINSVDKLTGKDLQMLVVGGDSRAIYGIRVDHEVVQPMGVNYCAQNNGGCDFLCLLSPVATNSSYHACACPDHMELSDDGRSCMS